MIFGAFFRRRVVRDPSSASWRRSTRLSYRLSSCGEEPEGVDPDRCRSMYLPVCGFMWFRGRLTWPTSGCLRAIFIDSFQGTSLEFLSEPDFWLKLAWARPNNSKKAGSKVCTLPTRDWQTVTKPLERLCITFASWFTYVFCFCLRSCAARRILKKKKSGSVNSLANVLLLFCLSLLLCSYCNPLLFRCRFNFGNFGTSIFLLPKLNLHLNFYSGLTDSGPLSRYRNVLRTETANFRFTENCTLPK